MSDAGSAQSFLTGGDAEVFIWQPPVAAPRDRSRCTLSTTSCRHRITVLGIRCPMTVGPTTARRPNSMPMPARRFRRPVTAPSSSPVASRLQTTTVHPPCIRAKREYVAIVDEAKGEFYCTGEYPSEESWSPSFSPSPLRKCSRPRRRSPDSKAAAVITSARTPMPHGAS